MISTISQSSAGLARLLLDARIPSVAAVRCSRDTLPEAGPKVSILYHTLCYRHAGAAGVRGDATGAG